MLLKKFPEAQYTLLDASSDMLAICRKRFPGENITYIRSYFRDYTFPDRQFDLIAAGFSLHHIDGTDKQWIFPLLYDALKEGGIFTCSDLMVNKNSGEHERFIEEWKTYINASYPDGEKWAWMTEHYDAFDRPDAYDDQVSWLRTAGFRHIGTGWREGWWVNLIAGK